MEALLTRSFEASMCHGGSLANMGADGVVVGMVVAIEWLHQRPPPPPPPRVVPIGKAAHVTAAAAVAAGV